MLLRVDGGTLGGGDADAFAAAAAPVPLRVRPSPRCRGLAHGLNCLIEEVLKDPSLELIARMDADDESLPGRMEHQRRFLLAHPAIDILGTACHELDEQGRYLQLKLMPATHREIVNTLPRSNPMNHPTVILRRRVFERGLRYREDVRKTEDYHLWIEAAWNGFHFSNLNEPLLHFRRDSQFFHRRGGIAQAMADLRVRFVAMRKLHLFSLTNVLWALAAFGLRLSPGTLQAHLYRWLR